MLSTETLFTLPSCRALFFPLSQRLFLFFRSRTTGSMLPWSSTAFFCGFSSWCAFWAPRGCFCNPCWPGTTPERPALAGAVLVGGMGGSPVGKCTDPRLLPSSSSLGAQVLVGHTVALPRSPPTPTPAPRCSACRTSPTLPHTSQRAGSVLL